MRKLTKPSNKSKIKRKKIFGTFSISICFFLVFFVLFGRLSQVNKFLIKEVSITGNKIVGKDEVFKIAKNELYGFNFSLFPKNNFLIYPKTNIEETIKNKFLRIESLSLEVVNFSKLNIIVKEREPGFVWCPVKNNDCYYLDKGGLVFDRAPDFSGGVFFKFQGGLKPKEIANDYYGKNLIESNKLTKLIQFKDEAVQIIRKNLGGQWTASSIAILDWDDFSIQFTNQKDKEWKIIFVGRGIDPLSNLAEASESILKSKGQDEIVSFETNLISIARNLEATVLSANFKSNYEKSDSSIDYIDLRFGKKVFYKFTNGNK